jgi:hypothetical protein
MKNENEYPGELIEVNYKERYILFVMYVPEHPPIYLYKSILFEHCWGKTLNREKIISYIRALHQITLYGFLFERESLQLENCISFDKEFLMEETEITILAELAQAYIKLHDVVV